MDAASRITELFTARALRATPPLSGPPPAGKLPIVSLAYGLADPTLFPREELVAATAAVMAEDAAAALNYGPTYGGLVDQIVARLQAQGVAAGPENILVGYGSSQILALLPDVFVEPGDSVIIEGPSFLGAVRRFGSAGARILTVPVDAEGMDVDALEELLRDLRREGQRPKFIYTMPTFHNPTGVTMPLSRRVKLVALAEEYGVVVVEDDAYGDLRFEGTELPNLATLDRSGWVIRVSTFSKTLAPGVRMGWAFGRREIIDRLAVFKLEGSSGPFLTRVVARYCADGRLEEHIQDLIELYRHKRDVMLDAIRRELPEDVVTTRPEGGFFVWCKLSPDMSARKLLPLAMEQGVAFLPGTECYANGQGDDAIRLAFSYQPADQIVEGIARLGAAMRALRD